jgi:microsomal epoxide hydrolase
MSPLVAYWRDRFDWRAHEARLNAFPQYKVRLHGIDLHFLHMPGKGPDPTLSSSPMAGLARSSSSSN